MNTTDATQPAKPASCSKRMTRTTTLGIHTRIPWDDCRQCAGTGDLWSDTEMQFFPGLKCSACFGTGDMWVLKTWQAIREERDAARAAATKQAELDVAGAILNHVNGSGDLALHGEMVIVEDIDYSAHTLTLAGGRKFRITVEEVA